MAQDREAPVEEITYSLEIGSWYRIIRGFIRFVLHLVARVEVTGLQYVPDKGPYLIIVNHIHWLDPPALMAEYPYRGHVFAAEKWEVHWLFGPIFRSLDAIFVQRGEVDRKALRQALGVLKGGGVLGLAPEGTRSKTGGLIEGRSGAAYMAYRTGVSVVPVVIWGQEKAFPSLRRLRRATIRVRFGPPFEPPPVEGKASAAQVHAFVDDMMYRLAALLPEEYRGLYSDVGEKRPDLVALYADVD